VAPGVVQLGGSGRHPREPDLCLKAEFPNPNGRPAHRPEARTGWCLARRAAFGCRSLLSPSRRDRASCVFRRQVCRI